MDAKEYAIEQTKNLAEYAVISIDIDALREDVDRIIRKSDREIAAKCCEYVSMAINEGKGKE